MIHTLKKFTVVFYAFILMTSVSATPSASATSAQAKTDVSAVVYVYHRFGEDKYPTTNTTVEQLDQQITFLQANNFTFLTLNQFKKHLLSDTPFPNKSVLFTVDDAYASALTVAWPRLKKAGIPMTIFVATDAVDAKRRGYLSWDQLRALQKEGVSIGHHTASHLHMVHAGKEAAKADIKRASDRFKKELGSAPDVFAYPYGEYSQSIKEMTSQLGFTLAFAQYSGAAALNSDLFNLPRFAINERYGTMNRFKLVSNSRALPVTKVIPNDPYITNPKKNPPMIGFTLDPTVRSSNGLTCYPSHLRGKTATILRPVKGRIEIRFDQALPKGRSRINCTLMGPDRRWYWFSRYFLVPGGKLD